MSNKHKKFSNGTYCDYDVIRTLPRIGSEQFLDGGWNVLVATNNRFFRDEFRICNNDVKKLINPALNVSGYFFLCEPKVPKYNHFKFRILYFDAELSLRSLLEIVPHEVSHLIDDTLDFINLGLIDTELRAYMMDYYCGKIFDMIDLSSGTKKPKFMSRKEIAASNATKLINSNDRTSRLKLDLKAKGSNL